MCSISNGTGGGGRCRTKKRNKNWKNLKLENRTDSASLDGQLLTGTDCRLQSDDNNDNGKTVGVLLLLLELSESMRCGQIYFICECAKIDAHTYLCANKNGKRKDNWRHLAKAQRKLERERKKNMEIRTKRQIRCNKNLVARVDSCRISCSGEWKRKMTTESNG